MSALWLLPHGLNYLPRLLPPRGGGADRRKRFGSAHGARAVRKVFCASALKVRRQLKEKMQ